MDRLKRFLPFVGYGLFYLVVFFMSCYVTFPYEKLRDRLVAEFAGDQKGKPGAQRIEIDELEPYAISGVRLRGVKFTQASNVRFGEPDQPPTTIEFDELRARTAILARLFGKTKITFYAKAFGGELEGTFWETSDERHLDVDLHDLAVSRVDALSALVGLPLFGSMTGKVDLTFPDKRASKAEGTIKLVLSDLAAGDGVTKIKNMLALPKVKVGDLTVDADVKEGVLKINKLGAAGGDLELVSDGTIKLRDQPNESTADIYARFKFSDAYKGRSEMTKLIFGAPGSSAPPAFELDPGVKSSKRTDGFYGWHLSGMMTAPRFEPFAGSPPVARPTTGPPAIHLPPPR